ncbi:MAG: polyvinylalcohol dehydrogenase, partial [Verrucomicrobiaceae bacterium]
MFSNLTSTLAVIAAMTLFARAEDWPQWRGPSRDGISQEKGWLDQFPSQGPQVAWQTTVGLGFSSIVVGNGKAFT